MYSIGVKNWKFAQVGKNTKIAFLYKWFSITWLWQKIQLKIRALFIESRGPHLLLSAGLRSLKLEKTTMIFAVSCICICDKHNCIQIWIETIDKNKTEIDDLHNLKTETRKIIFIFCFCSKTCCWGRQIFVLHIPMEWGRCTFLLLSVCILYIANRSVNNHKCYRAHFKSF